MTIRNRLLVLLLAISLTPLIVTSVLQQASIRMARDRLASRTRKALDAAARQTLQEHLYSHVEILERERQLTDALLRRQVREVELRLANLTPPPFTPTVEMALVDYRFGADPNLTNPSVPHHPYLSGTSDPNVPRLAVDYRAQSCFVVRDSNETWTKPALVAPTPVYEETCTHGPRGILWLYTSLDIGVHTASTRVRRFQVAEAEI